MKNSNKKIGTLNKKVIDLLNLDSFKNRSIYMGNKNIEHIKKIHADDYHKYGKFIKDIIKEPTYVSKHPKDRSIHYIKVFEEESKHVKIVVRPTTKNILFVRTIFTISEKNIMKYRKKNALKTY